MKFFSRMRFGAKLRLMTIAGIAGLAVFAAISYSTLCEVAVNSRLYQDIALGYQLGGDIYDPPASLVNGMIHAIEAEDATAPQATEAAIRKLQQAHQDFDKSQAHYQQVLPEGEIRNLMGQESIPAGNKWYAIAESEYIPALRAGDHERARAIRISKMNPLYEAQKATNDRLSTLTASWIPNEEALAGSIIRTRTIELGVIVLLVALALFVVGTVITRGIVRPAHSAVSALEAMAQGDYTHCLNLDAADEIGDISRAVNHTINSFREMLSTITSVSTRTAAASAQLTATAQDTSSQSHQHAAETAHAANEISHMAVAIQQVAAAAHTAAESGSATKFAAEQGHHVVEETMNVIRSATQVTSRASEQISSLGRNSEQIGQIIGVIEEIASQTNLLALNAAIEAARAGEQGRGFAVVAGEVRRLAERTTEATKEITTMISSIQQETANAVLVMDSGREKFDEVLRKSAECDQALGEIVALVHETGNKIQEITCLAGEQSEAVSRVTSNMDTISGFSRHAEQASDQTAMACNELTSLVSELERQVHTFSVSRAACLDFAA